MKTKVTLTSAKTKKSESIAAIMEQPHQTNSSKDAAKEIGEYFYKNIPVRSFTDWIAISISVLNSCEDNTKEKQETIEVFCDLLRFYHTDISESKTSADFVKPILDVFSAFFGTYKEAKRFFVATYTKFLNIYDKADKYDELDIVEYPNVNSHLLALTELYKDYQYLCDKEFLIMHQA